MLGLAQEDGTPTLGVEMPFTEENTSFDPKASEGWGPEPSFEVLFEGLAYAGLGTESIDSYPYEFPLDVK